MTIENVRYLTVHQTAARLNVSKSTIWRYASERPEFPNPVKIGQGVTRWRLSDLEAFEAGLGVPS